MSYKMNNAIKQKKIIPRNIKIKILNKSSTIKCILFNCPPHFLLKLYFSVVRRPPSPTNIDIRAQFVANIV